MRNVNDIQSNATFRFAGDAVKIEFVSVVTVTPEAAEDVLTQMITQRSRDVQLTTFIYIYKPKRRPWLLWQIQMHIALIRSSYETFQGREGVQVQCFLGGIV